MASPKSGTLYRRCVRELAEAGSKLAEKLKPYVRELNQCVQNEDCGKMFAQAWRAFVKLMDYNDVFC